MGYRIYLLLFYLLSSLCFVANAQAPDIRLGWNFRSIQEHKKYYVANDGMAAKESAHYPRIKRLSNGDLLLVHMDGKFGWNIYARKSTDDGLTWSDAICVRKSFFDSTKNDNVCYACPDFIQLPDGTVLLAFQWRYDIGFNDVNDRNKNCGIEIIKSNDYGSSFDLSSIKRVFWGRNWEPSFVLLPTGELQLFFTANQTGLCHAGLIRSYDSGETWVPATTPTFTASEYISSSEEYGMNGMAVGQYLDNNNGIAIAVENAGQEKSPWIVWSAKETNWRYDDFIYPSTGPSAERKWLLNKNFRGFAPYMAKLPGGEIIVQSNGTYNGVKGIWTFIGDSSAKNFSFASKPYDPAAWWGSIAYIGNDQIISAANCGYKSDGSGDQELLIAKAYINRAMTVGNGELPEYDLSDYAGKSDNSWFIGSKSQAQCFFNMRYSAEFLNLSCDVFDKKINYISLANSDAIILLISRKNKIDNSENTFRFTMSAGDLVKLEKADEFGDYYSVTVNDLVKSITLNGSKNNNLDEDTGYQMRIGLPWALIGGSPNSGDEFRMHVILKNNDNGNLQVALSDEMCGQQSNDSNTWLPFKLADGSAGLTDEKNYTEVLYSENVLKIITNSGNQWTKASLYNNIGLCVMQQDISKGDSQNYSLDVLNIERGIYFLRLIDTFGRSITKKIVIRN